MSSALRLEGRLQSKEKRSPPPVAFRFLSLCMVVFLGAFLISGALQENIEPGMRLESGKVYRLAVPGNVSWTDTGYEVLQGEEIQFRAAGGISLQQGNPMAYCGPGGYELRTLQQPLPDNNIGALIGKVVLLISIEIDEETGEETRNEIIKLFYIGSNQRIVMPIDGRLFLGINEDLVPDNSGRYSVEFSLVREKTNLFP